MLTWQCINLSDNKKELIMKLHPLVLALGLIPLVGCNDPNGVNNSGSDPDKQVTYSVRAVDGYLSNALVWLDKNGNFQLDEDEPSARSGDGGVADIVFAGVKNPGQYPIVVQAIAGQTIDIGDDVDNPVDNGPINTSYMMSAPAGEKVITPLSTLVHVILEQKMANEASGGSELTDEEIEVLKIEAVGSVAELLGISNSDVLGDFIEEGNDAVAYAAENVVAAQILPETPEEMNQVVEEAKLDDPDDTKTNSKFLANAEAATDEIKTAVESAGDNADFSAIAPVFSESDDTTDADGDGVPNHLDAFDDDKDEWVDTDDDNIGNNADPDDDGDEVNDVDDAFPLDKTETVDTDNDGTGNNADLDDDGDGVNDVDDAFSLDKNETVDTDGDEIGNNADLDDDGDGVNDEDDAFSLDKNETVDTDGDEIGNNADLDDDGDGVNDEDDAFSLDKNETVDTDGDEIGNNADLDDDADGLSDISEAEKGTNPLLSDTDNDSVNDYQDAFPTDPTETLDSDGDNVGDNADPFDDDPTEWADSDDDGIGDNQDADTIPASGKNAADFLADNNNFSLFEFDDDELYYEKLNWSSADNSLTSDDYYYDENLNVFIYEGDEEGGYESFILSAEGVWLKDDGTETEKLIPQSDGSLLSQIIESGEESTGIGKELLLENRNIYQSLLGKGVIDETFNIDKDAIFSAGSTALEATWVVTPGNNEYTLFNWNCHDDSLPSTQLGFTNCNTLYQFRSFSPGTDHNDGPALTLESLVVPSAGESGVSFDFLGFSALMGDVSTQLYANNTGAFYNLNWDEPFDYHRLSTNLTWSEKDVGGQTLYVLNTSEPQYAEQIDNSFFVELEDYVRMGRIEGIDEETETNLLFNQAAEQDILDAIGTSTLPDSLATTSGDQYNYSANSTPVTSVPQAYLDAIETNNTRPLPASMFNDQYRLIRLNSEGEPRAYDFHSDGTWTYYKRGIQRGTHNYKVDPENPQVLLLDKGGNTPEFTQEFAAYAVTDFAADKALNVLIYEQFPGEADDPDYPDPNLYYAEHWASIMYAYSEGKVKLCEMLDSGWDDGTDLPITPRTSAEFEQTVEECQSWWGDQRPMFTLDMLGNKKLVMGHDEYIQFPETTDQPAVWHDEDDATEGINWLIDDKGRLQLSLNNDSLQVSVTWVISDTDGVTFSAKIYEKNTNFTNFSGDQGEIWSELFRLENSIPE
jgi:hypothetical protein